MYRRTVETLKQNKNVYYDATNISRKRREHLLNQLKQRLKWHTIQYNCIIFAIDIDELNFYIIYHLKCERQQSQLS